MSSFRDLRTAAMRSSLVRLYTNLIASSSWSGISLSRRPMAVRATARSPLRPALKNLPSMYCTKLGTLFGRRRPTPRRFDITPNTVPVLIVVPMLVFV